MAVKTNIAIVGAASAKGIEIAGKLSTGNYRLLLLSDDVSKLSEISSQIKDASPGVEIEVIDCLKDGCWEADIIILAVTYKEQKRIIERIREVATQKMVAAFIDDTGDVEFVPGELQRLLPYAKVVEVLNNVDPLEIFVAGDEEEAVQTIATLLGIAGYLPIIKGSVQ